MKVLLDTHIALWMICDSEKLPDKTVSILKDDENVVYYSTASVWEIALKHQLHPDQIPMNEKEFVSLCEKTGLTRLEIGVKHIFELNGLKQKRNAVKHNDPFDRLLIAQAKSESMSLITHDKKIASYKEDCIFFA